MKKFDTVPVPVHTLVSITCNMCGKVCKDNVCADLTARWGYLSSKDLEDHEAQLCEPCYDKLVKTFKIPVDRQGYDMMSGENRRLVEDERG